MAIHHRCDPVLLMRGDALQTASLLPPGMAQTIVTSPPYFGLRDYGHADQLGAEPTVDAYVGNLVAVFRELRRVLADDGTLWLNLGDSYDRTKNLLGVPWRMALALQADGWTLRSDIIWAKRNIKPEAVRDRVTQAHEYLFMLTKSRRYYYDADAVREPSVSPEQEAHNARYAREYLKHSARAAATGQPGNVNNVGIHSRPGRGGRNRRSVWTVSSVPFKGAHFAVYPPELIRPCIRAGSRPGDVVLDPFSGSGTTGMVALQDGRRFLGIDVSKDYLDLSLRTRLAGCC